MTNKALKISFFRNSSTDEIDGYVSAWTFQSEGQYTLYKIIRIPYSTFVSAFSYMVQQNKLPMTSEQVNIAGLCHSLVGIPLSDMLPQWLKWSERVVSDTGITDVLTPSGTSQTYPSPTPIPTPSDAVQQKIAGPGGFINQLASVPGPDRKPLFPELSVGCAPFSTEWANVGLGGVTKVDCYLDESSYTTMHEKISSEQLAKYSGPGYNAYYRSTFIQYLTNNCYSGSCPILSKVGDSYFHLNFHSLEKNAVTSITISFSNEGD
jgi:hypothetical protein